MLYVEKSSGNKEPFSEQKLSTSIAKAGIPHDIQTQALIHVKNKIYNNIPTHEIYHHVMEYLGKSPLPYTQSRYHLKRAIMEFGPTGYPFEDFIARIFTKQGYQCQTRQIIQGTCISHEIDVLGKKKTQNQEENIIVEAKFHNTVGIKTDIHVALYTQARFEDVEKKHNISSVWLVTNTNLTTDAITYAHCKQMKLMSWGYPETNNIESLVEKFHLYPITTLFSLSQAQKQQLLTHNIVLCSELLTNPHILDVIGLDPLRGKRVLEDARLIEKNPARS